MRNILLSLLAFAPLSLVAAVPEVDYSNPKEYIVSGVCVEGNKHFASQQIISLSGLQKGLKIKVPGDDITNVIRRLWLQRYFEDVAIEIDHLSANGDSAFLCIRVAERPRVSKWSYSGVKSGERKDLQERLNLKRGGEYSDYVKSTSVGIIKRYFAEKGFINCDVDVQVKEDSVIRNAIKVNFAVDKKKKVKIKTINFIGNDNVSDYKIACSMKKTKSNKIYNFFHSKKFNADEYINDKKNAISVFNEAGYRDAKLVKDSIYYISEDRIGIDLTFEQGDKYYFRDVIWTGNSVYPAEVLNDVLAIKKGDVYDMVSMQKRLFGGNQNEMDVSKLYRDNGYLFFNLTPVETNIQNDSVDVEMRISEGKQATLNNIVINGNDLTNEKVVRRQLFTRPGYLFSQTDFERSIREIASLGQFDPEAISDPARGYSIIPNQANNTVDLIYNVTEKPSSQFELSGGWGGNTFVATIGLSFNNFSSHRLFEKGAWRPVPLGDAQTFSLRLQTNGSYYTAFSISFMEPWLTAKKPQSLSLSAYYTRQTNSYVALNIFNSDRMMEVFGASASIGRRLKWPDNFFVFHTGLNWQTYKLTNWYSGYFIFDNGLANNLSLTLALSRNSTDQQIFPRQGSDISLSLQLTPPYSLFRKYTYDKDGNKVPVASWKDVDYNATYTDPSTGETKMLWSAANRYHWIEYHKWKFNATTYTKLIGNLIMMTRVQFGYLGYYNRNLGYSPFEGFLVGGDGMSGYNTYGSEVISLRGYTNYSLTPYQPTVYNTTGYAYAGNVYDKFTIEFRYPILLQPASTIFALAFLEGGNCWADIRDCNPFQIKRSAGVGVRVFLPMVGLLGVDWGYGFDDATNGGSQFHFVIGQQF